MKLKKLKLQKTENLFKNQSVENVDISSQKKLDGSTNLNGAPTFEAYEYINEIDEWELKDFEALETRLYK